MNVDMYVVLNPIPNAGSFKLLNQTSEIILILNPRLSASQVWRQLPLYLRLALALVDACRSSTPTAEAHADGAALREYLQLLPQIHAGALSWGREELIELQDAFMVRKVETEYASLSLSLSHSHSLALSLSLSLSLSLFRSL